MINYCKLIWAGDNAGFGSFVHDCDKEGDNWSASIIICQMQDASLSFNFNTN